MPLLLYVHNRNTIFQGSNSKFLFSEELIFLINGKLHTHQGDLEPKSSTSTSFLQPIGGSLLS